MSNKEEQLSCNAEILDTSDVLDDFGGTYNVVMLTTRSLGSVELPTAALTIAEIIEIKKANIDFSAEIHLKAVQAVKDFVISGANKCIEYYESTQEININSAKLYTLNSLKSVLELSTADNLYDINAELYNLGEYRLPYECKDLLSKASEMLEDYYVNPTSNPSPMLNEDNFINDNYDRIKLCGELDQIFASEANAEA